MYAQNTYSLLQVPSLCQGLGQAGDGQGNSQGRRHHSTDSGKRDDWSDNHITSAFSFGLVFKLGQLPGFEATAAGL